MLVRNFFMLFSNFFVGEIYGLSLFSRGTCGRIESGDSIRMPLRPRAAKQSWKFQVN